MTRKKKPDLPEGDDGRTIANMNVEGMPWYVPKQEGAPAPLGENAEGKSAQSITPEESRYYTWGALKAALIVVGVMCVGLVLFVVFCQFIWFR